MILRLLILRLLLLLPLSSHAQELITATLDAGGGLTSGDSVEITGSLGGFGAVTSGDDTIARAGFPGQLYDPALVGITPGDAVLAENSAAAFTAEVICDDDTLLPATAVTWSVDSFFLNVTPDGLVTAALFPDSFAATLTASSLGVSGTASISGLDPDPDNYGLYAGDGLPDAWQTLHFGNNDPSAAPFADSDHDGQNNQSEYLAGTDPNDAASRLRLQFAAPAPPPGQRILEFTPFLPGRTYTLESSAALTDSWTAIAAPATTSPEPGTGQITDSGAAAADRKFYRLHITVP